MGFHSLGICDILAKLNTHELRRGQSFWQVIILYEINSGIRYFAQPRHDRHKVSCLVSDPRTYRAAASIIRGSTGWGLPP
jgi:hypothetical protein